MSNLKMMVAMFAVAMISVSACSNPQGTKMEVPTDADADGDGDSDSDSDSDGDSDTDTDNDADSDADSHEEDTEDDTSSDTREVDTSGCGNGVIDSPEVCDDGNSESGDGCSPQCDAVEDGFVCSVPGEPCIYTVACGDGGVNGGETCDDFNTSDEDGCSSVCQVETGWICPFPGEDCIAAECGDGLIIGKEECDDGNADASDGCSNSCQLEDGWHCAVAGAACYETVCNDGEKEGKEPCDDGNLVVGDGCTPFCEIEPDCGQGACKSACGDGIILPGDDEECDDGNLRNFDGCSDDCKIEEGYDCENVEEELQEVLEVPITYRDFILDPLGDAERHPDFQAYLANGIASGLVEKRLGTDGKPVLTDVCEPLLDTETEENDPEETEADTESSDDTDTTENDTEQDTEEADTTPPAPLYDPELCPDGPQMTSAETFYHWYNDVPDVNITYVTKLALEQRTGATYYFENDAFFPLDDMGWVAEELEATYAGHNFGFTSELRYWFKFEGGEMLQFTGDDDVWVFINDQLVVDIGGVHRSQEAEVVLDDALAEELGLVVGQIYEIVLFHAERRTSESHYNLTLSGFTAVRSQCQAICGDGIVAGDETCDDGVNDGSYGSCESDCTRGPRCGDGIVQNAAEECDDGINLTVYTPSNEPGCAPGCILGAYCGDGVLSSLFGEICDDGKNPGGYGECAPDCTLDIRCGDKIVQREHGEQCDDGNKISGDGCALDCTDETIYVE